MMEQRYGVQGSVWNGIFFTEQVIPRARPLRRVRVEISRQNANLNEIKQRMAQQASARNAVAIMNFRYGQRKHAWWELVFTFKWDTESWYGEGEAVDI